MDPQWEKSKNVIREFSYTLERLKIVNNFTFGFHLWKTRFWIK